MHIVNTGDGSHTVTSRFSGEHYHSTHGAVGESLHVFLRNGLDALGPRAQIRVLEMGFGTGLNALLTRLRARRLEQLIDFVSVESQPLPQSIISQLNYGRAVEGATDDILAQLHGAPWGEVVQLEPFFQYHQNSPNSLEKEGLHLKLHSVFLLQVFQLHPIHLDLLQNC